MATCVAWADETRAKGRPSAFQAGPGKGERWRPTSNLVEHPLVIDPAYFREDGEPSRRRTDQGPRLDALREEGRRRGNQDAFYPRGTRRASWAFVQNALVAFQFGSSSRRPFLSEGGFAIEGARAFGSAS